MKSLIKGLGLLAVMLVAGTAHAGTIKEYSADMVDAKTGQVVGKYYVTEKKIRVDSSNEKGGGNVISIIRMDQDKMYALQEDKTYMEIPFKGTVTDLESIGTQMMGGIAPQRKVENLGSETVSGYKAEKSKVTTTMNMMGQTFTTTAHEWKAKEFDMPLRTQTDKGETMEMRNIKVGAPPASVFEIPAGYTRNVEMENMMKQMRKMPAGGGHGSGRQSIVPAAGADVNENGINEAIQEGMNNMLKGMMQ
ncbi:MAG: DUF4412 domain-containing protein [Alphaproteobacteria bacterium]|nr:DUF4412 domain-containing protein [Alphaproteobacteria bacterium]